MKFERKTIREKTFIDKQYYNKNQLEKNILQKEITKRKYSLDNINNNIDTNKIDFNIQNNFNKAILIFKKGPKNYNEKQFFLSFLSHLEPFNDIFKELDNNKNFILNLFNHLKYKFIPKEKLLDNLKENFYIILKGKIEILVSNNTKIYINQEQFIYYLLKLKIYNENEIIETVFEANKDIFNIEENTFDIWIKKAFHTLIYLNYENNVNEIKKFDPSFNINKLFENIEIRKILLKYEKEIFFAMKNLQSNNPFLKNIETSNFLNNKNLSSEEFLNRYKIININKDKKNINKFFLCNIKQYYKTTSLKKGNYFINIKDENEHHHNNYFIKKEILISKENCELAILNKNDYNKILKDLIEKIKKSKTNFLLELKLFNPCNERLFINYFVNFFQKKIFHLNDKLFIEGTKNKNKIYFICEGEFIIKCKKNFNELNNILNDLGINELDENDSIDNNQVNLNEENFEKFQNKKNNINLKILKNNELIGLDEDCVLNNKYLFTVECISLKSKVYEIHKNYFDIIINNDWKVKNNLKEYYNIHKNLLIKYFLNNKISKKNFFDYFQNNNKYNLILTKIFKNEKPKINEIIQNSKNNATKFRKIKINLKKNELNNNIKTIKCLSYDKNIFYNSDSNILKNKKINSINKNNLLFPKINYNSRNINNLNQNIFYNTKSNLKNYTNLNNYINSISTSTIFNSNNINISERSNEHINLKKINNYSNDIDYNIILNLKNINSEINQKIQMNNNISKKSSYNINKKLVRRDNTLLNIKNNSKNLEKKANQIINEFKKMQSPQQKNLNNNNKKNIIFNLSKKHIFNKNNLI